MDSAPSSPHSDSSSDLTDIDTEAVWDLGESIRHANMTEAPAIAEQLDSLRNSLEILTFELTKFFVEVANDFVAVRIILLANLPPCSCRMIAMKIEEGFAVHTTSATYRSSATIVGWYCRKRGMEVVGIDGSKGRRLPENLFVL